MDAEPRSHNERRGLSRWLVPHPSFAWYLRGMGLGALFASAFFAVASWYYDRALLQVLSQRDLFADAGLREALSTYATLSLFVTAIGVVGAPLFVIVFSLYFVHRIAGPIYRLKNHMHQLIEGGPASELVLRRDDQLQDVCATYNQLLHHLELLEPKPEQTLPARAPTGA